MTLFHYTTWPGERIKEEGIIRPKNKYALGTVSPGTYPPLVFLTTNPVWEPSVQAGSIERYWEKCGSCPEVYKQLDIPCWQFIISEDLEVHNALALLLPYGLSAMFSEAIRLGSDPDEWYVAFKLIRWEGVCKIV